MRAQRAVALVLLTALVSGFGLPWLSRSHQFNDDPHWAVALGADATSAPRLDADRQGDADHCQVCHWLRTMHTAVRPAQTAVSRDVRQVAAPTTSDSRVIAARAQAPGARGPPPSFL